MCSDKTMFKLNLLQLKEALSILRDFVALVLLLFTFCFLSLLSLPDFALCLLLTSSDTSFSIKKKKKMVFLNTLWSISNFPKKLGMSSKADHLLPSGTHITLPIMAATWESNLLFPLYPPFYFGVL